MIEVERVQQKTAVALKEGCLSVRGGMQGCSGCVHLLCLPYAIGRVRDCWPCSVKHRTTADSGHEEPSQAKQAKVRHGDGHQGTCRGDAMWIRCGCDVDAMRFAAEECRMLDATSWVVSWGLTLKERN